MLGGAISILSRDAHPSPLPPAPPAFSLRFSRDEGRVVVGVDGELDTYTGPVLGERLADLIEAQGNLDVVVDLSATTFIDSTGLTTLVAADRALHARGGRFLVARPTAPVRRLLDITGLDRVLDVAPRGRSPR